MAYSHLFDFDFHVNMTVKVVETGGDLDDFVEAISRQHGSTNEAVNFALNVKDAARGILEPPFCKGHVAIIGKLEYFFFDDKLYRAQFSNPIDQNGYRQGARWQCPKHMAQAYIQQVRAAC